MKELDDIKHALAAGPTQGEWLAWAGSNGQMQVGPSTNYTVAAMFRTPLEGQKSNATYIATCNPSAMQAIIDHIEAQDAEIERLRAAIKPAYEEGFYSSETYNDTLLNSAEETWPKSQAAVNAAMKETP